MENNKAGIALPAEPTINSCLNFDQSIFLKLIMKNGRNAKPATAILKLATCNGEKAISPFLIKKKELPQTNERSSKVAKPMVGVFVVFSWVDNGYFF